mmetsp:Transcript_20674/g.43441  ORF Transcript_20674/g.43441 Transcript_20674/m.43441 type:complete len:463 (+) Transcript_20674:372-1760(+)
MSSGNDSVSAKDWIMGITFSVIASVIGAASKLAIRKSWLIDADRKRPKASTLADLLDCGSTNRGEEDAQHAPISEISVRSSIHHGSSSDDNAYNEGKAPQHIQTPNDDNANTLPTNRHTYLAPLEVGSPSSKGISTTLPTPTSLDQDFFSMEGDDASAMLCNREQYPTVKRKMQIRIWLLYICGMIGMSFLNPLFCVLAMKYANPSILAPFSGLTLVWVILFSRMVVGEHPELSQKVACACIIAGEVMVALFGDHTNNEWDSYDDVIASYKEPSFVAFIIFMILWLLFLIVVIRIFPKPSYLRKLAWGSLGGSITGFQNFLKDGLTILGNAKEEGNGVPTAFFLFFFLAMFTSFVGLLFLAACMKRFDATYSSAMFVVSFVLSASFMSAIHYNTFQHLDNVDDLFLYPVGLMVLFYGATILITPSLTICFAGEDDLLEDESIAEPPDSPIAGVGNRERLLSK